LKRQFSMPLHLGMGYTNSNVELSNLQWQLMEPKIVLPKLVLMNHFHWNIYIDGVWLWFS
jgi:hypothetical protein